MEHYFGVAKEEGLSDDEIAAVQSIVMAVSAGRVRAQFHEAVILSQERNRQNNQQKCGSSPKELVEFIWNEPMIPVGFDK